MKFKKPSIIRSVIVISLFFLTTSTFKAQPVADFTGIWIQDKNKTDDFYKSYNIIFTVKQTVQVFTLDEDILSDTGEKVVSNSNSFNLDGKETSAEVDGGINKKSATWSADKKTLTIMDTRTIDGQVMGSYRAFSMSPDGKILTINTTDANPLTGLKVKQVFNKK